MTPLTANHARGAGYYAALHLHQDSIASTTMEVLFTQINFGKNPKTRRAAMARAVDIGWLKIDKQGSITLGAHGVEYFADRPEAPTKYIGQIAAARDTGNVYDRPALSKKHIPNSKGTRADVPAFSVRENMRFSTLAGGV